MTREFAASRLTADNIKQFVSPVSGMVNITYPLTNPDVIEIKEANSVGELLWDIAQGYKKIYDEETETTENEIVAPEERGQLLNRNKTTGIHGIFGHDIGDLFIEGVSIRHDGFIDLQMGS